MSVDATITYALAQELNEHIEIVKFALERSNNNIDKTKQTVKNWRAAQINGRTTNKNVNSFVSTSLIKNNQDVSASIFKIKCDNEAFIETREFENLAKNIGEELNCYDQIVTTQSIIEDIRKDKNCIFEIEHKTWLTKSNALSLITTYNHNNKIAAMVETEVTNREAYDHQAFKTFSYDCAMHVVAYDPLSIDSSGISPGIKEKLVLLFEKQLLRDGKNIQHWDIAIKGKIDKWSANNCMLTQFFIKNDAKTLQESKDAVSKIIGSEIKINKIVRYAVDK